MMIEKLSWKLFEVASAMGTRSMLLMVRFFGVIPYKGFP